MNPFSLWTPAQVALHNRKVASKGGRELEDAEPGEGVERESELHYQILDECRKRGWICFHGSMAHKSRRNLGEPDCCVVGDGGRVWFLELKAAKGKLSTEQAATIAWLKKLGAEAHVLTSLEQFLKLL